MTDILRQLIDEQVTPALSTLDEATKAAGAAAELADTASAFMTVADLATLPEANTPKATLALLKQWAEQWQITVDRTTGDEAASFLDGALKVAKASLTDDEVSKINGAISAWQATAPKSKRTRKTEGSSPVQWFTTCGECNKEIVDRNNLNSARWGVQQHMQAKHAQKWGEKAKQGSTDYNALTTLLESGEKATIRGVEFTVRRETVGEKVGEAA